MRLRCSALRPATPEQEGAVFGWTSGWRWQPAWCNRHATDRFVDLGGGGVARVGRWSSRGGAALPRSLRRCAPAIIIRGGLRCRAISWHADSSVRCYFVTKFVDGWLTGAAMSGPSCMPTSQKGVRGQG